MAGEFFPAPLWEVQIQPILIPGILLAATGYIQELLDGGASNCH